MQVPDIDRLLGMEVYATKSAGIGGAIKASAEDFVVEEVLVDGSKASVDGAVPRRVLGSTPARQRYLLCMLVKRNWDTFIATKNIAKVLDIEPRRLQFAGIKDAKAQTAQFITLENVSSEEAAKALVKGVQLYPVGYMREMIALFYLLGNHFTISINDTDAPPETMRQALSELSALSYFPNFFGHQRFGTTRPVTHLIGRALTNGCFEEAAMLFLANPSQYEHPASRQARQELAESRDFRRAAETYPKQLRFERIMLSHLSQNPTDYIGAFQRLPPKLQALFVQAHQSYLFNRFLSGRINAGLPLGEAVVGDFVVGLERSGLPLTTMPKTVTKENLAQINDALAVGKMRIALPIFGVKQKLSGGVMGQIEQGILEEENVHEKGLRFNVLSRVGGKGGLRTAVAPVKDFVVQEVLNGSVRMSFMLLRGCYATVLLRELIKPQNPVAVGF